MHAARNYLSQGPSYSQFCLKIRCHGNGGWQGKNLNDTSDSAGPKIGVKCKQRAILF